MVCAKTEDCTKDMTRDGLDVRTDGEWVWADKTSLGGDNGIAVAMILAILSDETLPIPPSRRSLPSMRRSAWTARSRWTART